MFLPSQHEKSIKFFRAQVRQIYQVIRVQADINTIGLLFDLIAFFLLTCCLVT